MLNCGYGKGSSIKEVIAEYQHVTGKDLNATIGPRRAGDISALISDPTRLMKLTGWSPEHAQLRDIINSSLSWELQINNIIRKF